MPKSTRIVARLRPPALAGFHLTAHARQRMRARGVSEQALWATLFYGRTVHVRGALVYAIGRKEVAHYLSMGLDLSNFDGVQVVCSPEGSVLTAYRGRHLKGLRPGRSARHALAKNAA